MTTRAQSIIHIYNDDAERAQKLCREWLRNKERNPITKRTINKDAKRGAYQEFRNICERLGLQVQSPSSRSKSGLSASSSISADMEIAMRMSMMELHENVNSKERWAIKKCGNENPITLMPFDADDYDHMFSIRIARTNGKYGKGACFRRDDLYRMMEDDKNANYERIEIPSNFMANWIARNEMIPIEANGLGGCAGGKLFVKIAPNNIFISLKSFVRLMKMPREKEWFAVPMFGGEKTRIGNVFSYIAISTTHGQSPGFILYKLYTRSEVASQQHILGNEDDDEYDVSGFTKGPSAWLIPLDVKTVMRKIKKILTLVTPKDM